MSFLEHAIALAGAGFHVFPLAPGSKLPIIDDFPHRATDDAEQIRRWWTCPVMGIEQPYNIGISTTRHGDGQALLVIDVDNKKGRKGDETLLALDISGNDLPTTLEQRTPTGGRHLVYLAPHPCKQGAGVLGEGLDIRSRGGFIVGAGSAVAAGEYGIAVDAPLAPAPQWLIDRCGHDVSRGPASRDGLGNHHHDGRSADRERAERRAAHYLAHEAPASEPGEHNDAAYRVAARCKDLGVVEPDCLALLIEHWLPRCEGALWSDEALTAVIANAYRYGQVPEGALAPEVQFAPAADPPPDAVADAGLHPFDRLNEEFAFVIAGGGHHVLWETRNAAGDFTLEHLAESSFHRKFASWKMTLGDGETAPVTKLWMGSAERRSFDGICFRPGQPAPKQFYNLWRGFAWAPLAKGEQPSKEAQASLDAFLEHARENVAGGDEWLMRWLIGYFAHLVQRPWEKPLVALVFKGAKGVGKNALIERVGALLGDHFMLASNRRYLVGNFNGHMENLLLFALDEAFWSGDKQAEGTLKDLVTGKWQIIEHKNEKPYRVENCLRVAVLGNEDWLVPASHDERRFAVYLVGDRRKQDRAFFQAMREGMERGGYRLLLRFLLDYDLTGIDVNEAPATAALLEQKQHSLEPFHQWWLECLTDGRLVEVDFSGWPAVIEKDRMREGFSRYFRRRNIRSRFPTDVQIGKQLKQALPALDGSAKLKSTVGDVDSWTNAYKFPDLATARAAWDRFMGHAGEWQA